MRSFNDLKFGTFIGRFTSDGEASMAVKGLRFSKAEADIRFIGAAACACRHGCRDVYICPTIVVVVLLLALLSLTTVSL